MAHHLELMDQSFVDKVTNIFSDQEVRNKLLASYAQVIETPTLRDIGIEYQYTLFNSIKQKGQHPIVMIRGFFYKTRNLF